LVGLLLLLLILLLLFFGDGCFGLALEEDRFLSSLPPPLAFIVVAVADVEVESWSSELAIVTSRVDWERLLLMDRLPFLVLAAAAAAAAAAIVSPSGSAPFAVIFGDDRSFFPPPIRFLVVRGVSGSFIPSVVVVAVVLFLSIPKECRCNRVIRRPLLPLVLWLLSCMSVLVFSTQEARVFLRSRMEGRFRNTAVLLRRCRSSLLPLLLLVSSGGGGGAWPSASFFTSSGRRSQNSAGVSKKLVPSPLALLALAKFPKLDGSKTAPAMLHVASY